MQQQEYDVVVVGSGMGGMCAGALAVKGGYKTLVIESRDRIGGRYSTEEIEGFKCPTGAYAIHYSGWVPKVFKELGAKLELNDSFHYSYLLKGKGEFSLPNKNRVAAFLAICSNIEVERAKLAGRIAKEVATQKILGAFKQSAVEPEKAGRITLHEWLLRYTDNRDVLNLFDTMALSWGVAHSYEMSAFHFFQFMSVARGWNDIGMAPKGNLRVMEELAKIVKTKGDVWTGSPAKRIVVKKGATAGVVVQKDGVEEVEIPCKVVISDVGPRKTVELAGSENFGDDYLADMRVRLRPVPCSYVHVASDRPLVMKGGEAGGVLVIGARRIIGACDMTNTCPELAPKGQRLTMFSANPRSTLVAQDDEEEMRQCTLDLKELFPDFEKHGRILKIEARNIDHDIPECRTWQNPVFCMPNETPVRSLYNVGDAALSTPGIICTSGCAENAKRVVETIKKRVKAG